MKAKNLEQELAEEKRLRGEIEEMLHGTRSELEHVLNAAADKQRRTHELEIQLERLRKAADGAEREIEQEMARLREQVSSEAQRSASMEAQLQVMKHELKETLRSRGVCRVFRCWCWCWRVVTGERFQMGRWADSVESHRRGK